MGEMTPMVETNMEVLILMEKDVVGAVAVHDMEAAASMIVI